MSTETDTSSAGPTARLPLSRWLWRSYIRAALVPLLLIELGFLAIYWLTIQVVYDRSAEAVTGVATASLQDAALREADVIGQKLQGIGQLTAVYAAETARALATPAEVSDAEKANHATTPDGVFYSLTDRGGSAVFFSGFVPVGEAEKEKVWRTVRLDPIMKAIKESSPLIAQLYLNTPDSLNRIYPWFDVLAIYPPKMDIASYNFFYEADAVHNPDRKVVWTDAYVDPAGAGWMVSAIAPSYAGDRLEAVVGIDITIGTIIDQVLDVELKGDGYALLVGRDGTILALPPRGEQDWGITELSHSYSEAILQDTFKPEEFNLAKRPGLDSVAMEILSRPAGEAQFNLSRPMYAAWSTIPGPGWKLVVLASRDSILSESATLRRQLAWVNGGLLAVLVLFYAGFFLVLWRRSVAMSQRVARPLAEIESHMTRISEGGTIPTTHDYEVSELQTVGDHLVGMGERLQAAQRARVQFLSSMSHELRTPLAAILGLSDLLEMSEGERLEGELSGHVKQISAAGWKLLKLVDGVMELSQVEGSRLPLPEAPVDLAGVVTQALSAVRPAMTAQEIELRVGPPPAGLRGAMADAEITRRILVQLLSNAAIYNRLGGRVDVDFAMPAANRVAILVRDTGAGIPADRHGSVFSPFNRLGHENSEISGAGIGLALAQRMAAMVGGEITFSSEEGKGSTFRLLLPAA